MWIPFINEMIEEGQMDGVDEIALPQFEKESFEQVLQYCKILDYLPEP